MLHRTPPRISSNVPGSGRRGAAARRVAALVAAATLLPSPAFAQQGRHWQVNVAGQVMHCTSWDGARALIQYNRRLNDVGHASRLANGQPLIQLNPAVMGMFSPIVAIWWFVHECAHHALPPWQNSEAAADCHATRQMVASGLIRGGRPLDTIARELRSLPGNRLTGHLPGRERARRIAACASVPSEQTDLAFSYRARDDPPVWTVSDR